MPLWAFAAFLLAGVAGVCIAQDRVIPLNELRSGSTFSSSEARALQQDDFANPGMLWVDKGEKLWRATAGSAGKSCASCHGDAKQSMKGVAARYPAIDGASGKLLDVEGKIQQCRAERQGAEAPRRESDELLSLATYVSRQSRGMPVQVSIDGAAKPHFEAGRTAYYRRQGQLNLSCAQCHEANRGRKLLTETISQGHGTGYPGYRLEWQNQGSLERRLRACFSGIRAEMHSYGAAEHLDLALFLAWRAQGLPVESPGVRR